MNSPTQIKKYGFYCKQRRFLLTRLKSCTCLYNKHDIGSASGKVQLRSNHTSICFDVNLFTIFIVVKLYFSFCVFQSQIFEWVLHIFRLIDEGSLIFYLIWSPRKYFNSLIIPFLMPYSYKIKIPCTYTYN